MKVGLFYPFERDNTITVDELNKIGDIISSRGFDVSIFTYGIHRADVDDSLYMYRMSRLTAEIIAMSDEIDIIHNLYGSYLLSFSKAISSQMVTTIFNIDRLIFEKPKLISGYFAYIGDYFTDMPMQDMFLKTPVRGNGWTPPIDVNRFADISARSYEYIIDRENQNLIHCTRPWGKWYILHQGEGFKVKRILVYPHQRLSYQRHKYRNENWVIIRGCAKVVIDGEEQLLNAGDYIRINKGNAHRIENIGDDNLIFVEVQTGTYLGEDDIERIEDDYGRTVES